MIYNIHTVLNSAIAVNAAETFIMGKNNNTPETWFAHLFFKNEKFKVLLFFFFYSNPHTQYINFSWTIYSALLRSTCTKHMPQVWTPKREMHWRVFNAAKSHQPAHYPQFSHRKRAGIHYWSTRFPSNKLSTTQTQCSGWLLVCFTFMYLRTKAEAGFRLTTTQTSGNVRTVVLFVFSKIWHWY